MVIDPIKKISIEIQSKAQVRALLFDKTFTIVLTEYSNYSNNFSEKNTVKLFEYTKMNYDIIKLQKNKQ